MDPDVVWLPDRDVRRFGGSRIADLGETGETLIEVSYYLVMLKPLGGSKYKDRRAIESLHEHSKVQGLLGGHSVSGCQ